MSVFTSSPNTWQSSGEPPLFYLGRWGIRLTGLIILLHIVAMLVHVTTGGDLVPALEFKAQEVWESHQYWRLVSHAFRDFPTFSWLLSLAIFLIYGSMVEARIGRLAFGLLYLGLIIGPPIILSLFYLEESFIGKHSMDLAWSNLYLISSLRLGVAELAIFVGCARMFPSYPFIFFGIPLRWIALLAIVVEVLTFLMFRQWMNCGLFLACCAGTLYTLFRLTWFPPFSLWSELTGGGPVVDVPERERRKTGPIRLLKPASKRKESAPVPPTRYEPKLKPRTELAEPSFEMLTVDEVLDKISREGFASLSQKERDILEAASKRLSAKDKGK